MFDGSTKSRKKVNLGGKRDTKESAAQLIERQRKERERRELERLRQRSASAVQSAFRRYGSLKRAWSDERARFDLLTAPPAAAGAGGRDALAQAARSLLFFCDLQRPDDCAALERDVLPCAELKFRAKVHAIFLHRFYQESRAAATL